MSGYSQWESGAKSTGRDELMHVNVDSCHSSRLSLLVA